MGAATKICDCKQQGFFSHGQTYHFVKHLVKKGGCSYGAVLQSSNQLATAADIKYASFLIADTIAGIGDPAWDIGSFLRALRKVLRRQL